MRSVIVDTDWWTDTGDVKAIRVMDYLHSHAVITVLAVMLDTTLPESAGSLQGFMASDGVTGIPVGLSHTVHNAGGTPGFQADLRNLSIARGYITGSETYPDAVALYRQMLVAAPAPIDVISIGYTNNLRDLLQSPADAISSLTGLQLVNAKVARLFVMGGAYPSGSENNFTRDPIASNSGSYLAANWPTQIVYSGFEVGNSVVTGSALAGLQPADLLAQAFFDTGSFGRPSWDEMTELLGVMFAAGNGGYTFVGGSNSVNASSGANIFTPGPGKDLYAVKNQPDAVFSSWVGSLLLKSLW